MYTHACTFIYTNKIDNQNSISTSSFRNSTAYSRIRTELTAYNAVDLITSLSISVIFVIALNPQSSLFPSKGKKKTRALLLLFNRKANCMSEAAKNKKVRARNISRFEIKSMFN